MLSNRTMMSVIMACTVSLLLASCYKDKTVITDTGDEITRQVSFSNDIQPIFNNSCNTSGCHNAGGVSPNLTVGSAFNVLITGNYINTGDPQASSLYLWMTGKKSTPMPLSGINKDYNALILAWIRQGANNN